MRKNIRRKKINGRAIILERLIPLSRANDDFDREFWQKAGAELRFIAAWQMVSDFYRIKGKNGYKLRLQRSIQNIQQA